MVMVELLSLHTNWLTQAKTCIFIKGSECARDLQLNVNQQKIKVFNTIPCHLQFIKLHSHL